MAERSRGWLVRGLAGIVALVVVVTVPWRIAALDHGRWRAGEAEAQLALARGVDHWIARGSLRRDSYTSGNARFDAEWLFGTHVMAALGFGQVALAHPAHRDEMIAAMDRALARLVEPELAAFDREGWGGAHALAAGRGHVAYLGYYGLALALRGRLGPSDHDALRQRFEAALIARFSRELMVETYPGERYPVDNAAAIGALALSDRPGAAAVVERWLAALPRLRDPASGLLFQRVGADGRPVDAPRASGTALAAYFLAFADEAAARDLYRSLEDHVGDAVLGFGAMAEYPPGHAGRGDIDSGPLIAGYSISGTGFALASARRFGTPERFASLWATTRLFGLPRGRDGRLHFVLGGPLGDAILFAMVTGGPR